MSNYTPPDNDNADFEIESYSPASNDSADFQFVPDIQPAGTIEATGAVSGGATAIATTATTAQAQATAGGASFGGIATFVGGAPDGTGTIKGGLIPGWVITHPQAQTALQVTTSSVTPTTITAATGPLEQETVDALRSIDTTAVEEVTNFGGVVRVMNREGGDKLTADPGTLTAPITGSIDGFLSELSTAQFNTDLTTADLTIARNTPATEDVTVEPATDWTIARQDGSGSVGFEAAAIEPIERDGDTLTIAGVATPEQAGAIHDLFARVSGAVRREVLDGSNFWADTTDGTLSVTVSAPDNVDAEGDWIVTDWELALSDRQRQPWDVTLTLGDDTN